MKREEDACAARGRLLVWSAVLLFAATGSIMRSLTSLGAEYPIDGRDSITSCGILLVGNICAFALVTGLYGRTWTRANLAGLDRSDWLGMVLSALLSSAVAPALTLIALETTSVTDVVLIGRIEPLLFLILSFCVLGGALDRFALGGAAIALAGVGLTLVLEAGGRLPDFGEGQLYAALAAVAFALSTVISRDRLQRVPFGIFMVFRLGMGTLLSVGAVWWRDGTAGFGYMLSPLLWQWMAVYGAVFVAGAQICWFSGLKCARPGDVSLAGVFSPVAAILFALVLLGEVPGPALWAGGSVIVLGIACGQFGARALERLRAWRPRIAAGVALRLVPRAWIMAHGFPASPGVPGRSSAW